MNKRPPDLPDFQMPPLVEVVLGVQFAGTNGLRTVHYGRLWDTFRTEFPSFGEHPPLDPMFETFGARSEREQLKLQFSTEPPLPRLWLMNAPSHTQANELLQFQPDRFLHNWRKTGDDATYPRYENIRERFRSELTQLNKFLTSERLGEIEPTQCEISYFNHILSEDGEDLPTNFHTVFSFWRDGLFDERQLGFEGAAVNIRFAIRDDDHQPIGRLHVTAQPGHSSDGTPMIALNLTARGRPTDPSIEGVFSFLDQGRDNLVRRFAALTTKKMHERWGRRQ